MDSHQDRAAARLAWARGVLHDPALTLAPASEDASFRSYWRTRHEGRSWIVMDSPPAQEDPRPWLAIGAQLAAAGLHVPAVQAHDLARGFLLIEDLGARLYLTALDERTADALYGEAMAALLRMQSRTQAAGLEPYDRAFLQRELAIMPEWFLGRHLGYPPGPAETDILQAAGEILLDSALEQPHCFVHRDFHSRNLLVVEGEAADTRAADLVSPGIIDFQGALRGPVAYDLASLLRDCYIAWPRGRVEGWVDGYRKQAQAAGIIDAGVDRGQFMRWFDLIGLQRHIKVLGIFCRLAYRDGKHGYLDDLARVYRYVIEVAAGYPQLHEMAALLTRAAGTRDLRKMADA